MKKNKCGVIINVLSYAAKQPSYSYGLYAAAKAALLSLTKSMAGEWAPYGIRVNAVSPGVTDTNMVAHVDFNKASQSIAQNRVAKPEEVAKAILFLASEDSQFIVGSNLEVDGGKMVIQNTDKAWSESGNY